MTGLELTINNEVYEFKFGFGFIKEASELFKRPMDGFKGKEEKVGLQYLIAYVVDREPEWLITLLDIANRGQNPRITRALLEEYLESDDCDIDEVFDQVIDFLSKSNCTKKLTCQLVQATERQKKIQEMEQQKELEEAMK